MSGHVFKSINVLAVHVCVEYNVGSPHTGGMHQWERDQLLCTVSYTMMEGVGGEMKEEVHGRKLEALSQRWERKQCPLLFRPKPHQSNQTLLKTGPRLVQEPRNF